MVEVSGGHGAGAGAVGGGGILAQAKAAATAHWGQVRNLLAGLSADMHVDVEGEVWAGCTECSASTVPDILARPFNGFLDTFAKRVAEADEFYAAIQPTELDPDTRIVQRQAFAGLLWSKQFYHFGVDMWLKGDPGFPPPPRSRQVGRNSNWRHLYCCDVLSMPDAFEYNWFAGWDLAFQAIPIALVDPEWSKRQLILMLREWYMHPSGQMAAYEWNFGDVNPPVHCWATLRVFQITKTTGGKADYAFLEKSFHKLLLNFAWWVNRKDKEGEGLFEGGFLGLDNISVFDRSHAKHLGFDLRQADATGWMAMFSLNMLAIALKLAAQNPSYEDICSKFFEHFIAITASISGWIKPRNESGPGAEADETGVGLWDEETGFFYDVATNKEDGTRYPVKARSLVGLIPLYATLVIENSVLDALPNFRKRMQWFCKHRADLVGSHITQGPASVLLSLVSLAQLPRILDRMLDEAQFLSPFGIRSLSKEHEATPYHFESPGFSADLKYDPAESTSPIYGGNSNWRGPVWFPVNFLIIEALQMFDRFYGDSLKVDFPTGSGNKMTLWQVAQQLSVRLIDLFRTSPSSGLRPVNGSVELFSKDPRWKDAVPFYEYMHGDCGAGLGASHQTGWTALVAKLIQQSGTEARA